MRTDIGTGLHRLLPYLAISALAIVSYGGALHNGYVWDDRYFLFDSEWIGDFATAVQAAFSPLFQSRSYVRPLPLLSIYAEALLFKNSAAASHGINIAIHVACSFLVFAIAARNTSLIRANWPTQWLPIFLAGAFAVHPALTENVVWISSRFDLMATLLMLLALWVAGSALSDWARALAVSTIFFAAALSKESAVALPVMIYAQAIFAGAARNSTISWTSAFSKRELRCYGLMFLAGVLYLALRSSVLANAPLAAASGYPLEEHVVRAGLALTSYGKWTLLPFIDNSPQHTYTGGDISKHAAELILACVGLCVAGLLLARRRAAGLYIAVWLFMLLPVLHLVPLPIGENIAHQRFIYAPSAWLFAFAPFVVRQKPINQFARKVVIALALLYFVASVLVVRSIVPMWKNDLVLWNWTVAVEPNSAEAHENLVWAYVDGGMLDDASRLMLKIADKGMSTSPNLAINMGAAHHKRGNYAEALHYYGVAASAFEGMPSDYRSRLLNNVALTYAHLGNVRAAEELLVHAIVEMPKNYTATGNLLALCPGHPLATSSPRAELVRAHTSRTIASAAGAAYSKYRCAFTKVPPPLHVFEVEQLGSGEAER